MFRSEVQLSVHHSMYRVVRRPPPCTKKVELWFQVFGPIPCWDMVKVLNGPLVVPVHSQSIYKRKKNLFKKTEQIKCLFYRAMLLVLKLERWVSNYRTLDWLNFRRIDQRPNFWDKKVSGKIPQKERKKKSRLSRRQRREKNPFLHKGNFLFF